MSQFLKTHRHAFSLVVLLIVVVLATTAAIVFRALSSGAARAQPAVGVQATPPGSSTKASPAAPRLSVADAESWGLMRSELTLSDEALAGIGVDESTADAIMNTTLDLARRRGAELERVVEDERAKRRALKAAYAALHQGDTVAGSPARVQSARRDLQQAELTRKRLRDQLAASAGTAMTFEQQARWRAARVNRDLPPAYRYTPGLSDADRSDIKRYLRDSQTRTLRPGQPSPVRALPGRLRTAADATERLIASKTEGIARSRDRLNPSPQPTTAQPQPSAEPAR